ncbi:MAG TPA: hypothetical protein VM884_08940 [Flavisolibacter sp.]|jgi:hypothetical protein|nr:hypothetical protein [Flavisolibacter sp.]
MISLKSGNVIYAIVTTTENAGVFLLLFLPCYADEIIQAFSLLNSDKDVEE